MLKRFCLLFFLVFAFCQPSYALETEQVVRKVEAWLGTKQDLVRLIKEFNLQSFDLKKIDQEKVEKEAWKLYKRFKAKSGELWEKLHITGKDGISDPAFSEHGFVRLLSRKSRIDDNKTQVLGLDFQMAYNWEIYWRSPGDAGYPPEIDWTASKNLKSIKMFWPLPRRFSTQGIDTIGYEKRVIFPLIAEVEDINKPLELVAKIDYLACNENCIPIHVDLDMTLKPGKGIVTPVQPAIDIYYASLPDAKLHKLEFLSAGIEPNEMLSPKFKDEKIFRVEVKAKKMLKKPDLFVESTDEIRFEAPWVTFDGDKVIFRSKITPSTIPEDGVLGKDVTITVADGRGQRGLEEKIKVKMFDDVSSNEPGLLFILAMAFIGGVILNLMPCVLPVLSLKVMGILSLGGAKKRDVQASFLATALGVVVSFLLLALLAVILKALGVAVGWGIQFQNIWFLGVMTVLLSFFAANLFGFFHFILPEPLAGFVGKPREGKLGHFLTGAFATLLATPCSAPFLGTAIGFALSASNLSIILIFIVMGIGMAGPYLLLVAFPVFATYMPRPGYWMVRLRLLLGFILLVAIFWLVSVMMAQIGEIGAGLFLAFNIGLIASLGMTDLLLKKGKNVRSLRWVLAVVLVILAFGQLVEDYRAEKLNPDAQKDYWVSFDLKKIDALVASGKTVFVDITADWCLTCRLNKLMVLNRKCASNLLDKDDVVAMRADWTKSNGNIADYLASFGRGGIPFNVVYGKRAPEGIVLPEILGCNSLKESLEQAVGWQNEPIDYLKEVKERNQKKSN